MKFNKGDRVIVTSKVSKHRGDLGKVVCYCKGKYPDMCRVEFPSGAVVNFYEDSLYLCSSKFNIGDVVIVKGSDSIGTVVNYDVVESEDVCVLYMSDTSICRKPDDDLELCVRKEIEPQEDTATCVVSRFRYNRLRFFDRLKVWIFKKYIEKEIRKRLTPGNCYTVEEMLEKLKEGNLV